MEAHLEVHEGRVSKMRCIRALLRKAVAEGLTSSEQAFLEGEAARLESKVAGVNARVGREVVGLGPYFRMIREASSRAAVAL